MVQVHLVDYRRRTISNTVPFTYINPDNKMEDFVEQDINNKEDLQKMLLLLSKKMDKINLNSDETKESNLPGKHF